MSDMNNNIPDRELNWDDIITRDQSDFVLLPEGEYPCTVIKFERARHNGSAKLPACNKAVLTIEIDGGALGSSVVTHNLFLYSKCESLLSAFFVSIGLKKKGDPLNMGNYWSQLIGKTGRVKVIQKEWTSDRDGTKHKSNRIDRFLEPATPTAPKQSWTPGNF